MKKYFAVVLLAVLILPLVASASWWNPASWSMWSFFRSVQNNQSTQTQKIIQTTTTMNVATTSVKRKVNQDKSEKLKVEETKTNVTILPVQTDSTGNQLNPNLDYSKYTVNGQVLSPQDYANYLARKVIDNNNTKRNVMDYDIYHIHDGTAYSPQQFNAIDCAYYNIGCPTIDVRIINR
ncbi:MAG: hypothetical protein NT077_01475 [Candidatus Taylorbacteria bacterium]|nr:hypothetical protein [Candidatus Taylorbacteria bacterium]